tara:strand:- start:1192 stop:1317 length:126 start_codon:yes stop_codon:yes gene_type:complete
MPIKYKKRKGVQNMENIAVKNKNGNWYYIYKTNWRMKYNDI